MYINTLINTILNISFFPFPINKYLIAINALLEGILAA